MTGISADRLLLAAPEAPQLAAAGSAFADAMQALMALEQEVRPLHSWSLRASLQ